MNLYLISQDVNSGYDTYDSAVVAAESEAQAARISPSSSYEWNEADGCWMFCYYDGRKEKDSNTSWVDDLDQVSVELLGTARPGTKKGIICASFNAG